MKRIIAALALSAATLCIAQSTEYLRPTADATTTDADCGGSNVASAIMSTVYTSKSGTGPTGSSALIDTMGAYNSQKYKARLFSTWQSTSNTYGALTINVSVQCSTFSDRYGGKCAAGYSTNGGTSWTNFYSYNGNGSGNSDTQHTLTATITGTALSSIQIRVCSIGYSGDGTSGDGQGEAQITIYDIWTTGTYGVGGIAHPGVQVIGKQQPRTWLFHLSDPARLPSFLTAGVVGGPHVQ